MIKGKFSPIVLMLIVLVVSGIFGVSFMSSVKAQLPLPKLPFNTAMGRPYQDIREVWAKSDGTNLNVNVTLANAPPKEDKERHVNIYVALDTKAGGQDWWPESIDVRYNLSEPEHFWEYCLALYDWTGTTQHADLVNYTWGRINAFSNNIGNVTVTNSTDGTIVIIEIPMVLIGNPSAVTIGVVTSEDYSKVKDTVGMGYAIPLAWQWIEVGPAIIDLSTVAGSSASVTDQVRDFVGKSFWDITGVAVNANATDIVFDVSFLSVSGLSVSWRDWWLAIEIDTDHVAGSGEPWLYATGIGSDTRFLNNSVSEWELCVVINSPTDIALWNVTGTPPNETAQWVAPPHGVTATLIEDQNKVRVAVPRSWLESHTWDHYLTVTVISGTDHGNRVYDIYGTYGYSTPAMNLAYGVEAHGFYIAYTDSSLNKTGPLIVTATIDIDPDTFNLKSKGEWITAYIELPEGYNVSDVDVSTISLNDTVLAERSDIQDNVLMVKFNRTDIISLLDVGNQTIKISGELTDSTPFEDTDKIRAIHAQITLTDLHTIHLDVNGALLKGENLKVKFHSYSGAYQGETTIWSGPTPAQVLLSTDLSQNSPIENAILVLTDNEENTILNLVNFVVHRFDLFTRITQIDIQWAYTSPSERAQYFSETIDIDMQWPYAPP